MVGTEQQGEWTVNAGVTAWGGIQLAGWLKGLLGDVGVGAKLWDEEWEIDRGTWELGRVVAADPSPADGAKYVLTDVVLSWHAGGTAASHDVYFGTVSPPPFVHNQPATTYDPGGLAKDTTYYWQIDEVDTGGTTKHEGQVWSFTTVPDIPVSDPDLVGWWKLDEGEGSTALDWSGHNHHGRVRGDPQWVAGRHGSALELDGTDDYVDFGNPPDLPSGRSPRSMCGWGKTNSVADGWRWIAAYGSAWLSQAMFIGMLGDDLFGGGYWDDIQKNDFWQVGVWHHICLTYNGTTARLYADGIEVASGTKIWNLVLNRAHIGRQVNDYAEFWDGLVDDVRIYNKALTQEEIVQVMGGDL